MNRKQIYLAGLVVWFFISGGVICVGLYTANSVVAVGSTLIAVGGSGSYYFYQEYVRRPDVTLSNKEMKFEKFLLFSKDSKEGMLYSYPVIQGSLTLKNEGYSTAKDCFIRLTINEDGNPFGRWQALKEEKIDLHPGLQASTNLIRFIPIKEELIEELNLRYQELYEEHEKKQLKNYFKMSEFPSIHFGLLKEGLEINDLTVNVQVPRRKAAEERLLKRYGIGEPDIFWARNIDASEKFHCSLEVGSEGYHKILGNIKIDLKEALKKAEWKPFIKRGDGWKPMFDILNKYGWSG